jgi:LmbE family N-acetylglucosaminyl deacetylase
VLHLRGRNFARFSAAVLAVGLGAVAHAVAHAAIAAIPTPADVARATAAAQLPLLDASTSLLVVAPHPDDETLCCAGIMQRVAHAGGRVSVVWITSGDASELDLLLIERSFLMQPAKARDLAVRRMHEARAATTLLGVTIEGQLFLGYPDRGLRALLAGPAPYTSPFTAAAAVPYPDAVTPGHAYTGASLEQDLAAVLDRVRPTLVLAPSPRDSHPDHAAAGRLTLRLMQQRSALPAVRCWIVHGGEGWPSPRELSPGLPLERAPLLQGVPLVDFELTPAEEDRKLAALRAYRTQMQTIGPFLLAFVRTTESFSAAP